MDKNERDYLKEVGANLRAKPIHEIFKPGALVRVYKGVDGYFVYTANGYCWNDDCCHTRAFDTVQEILDDLCLITPCSGIEGCCKGELDR